MQHPSETFGYSIENPHAHLNRAQRRAIARQQRLAIKHAIRKALARQKRLQRKAGA